MAGLVEAALGDVLYNYPNSAEKYLQSCLAGEETRGLERETIEQALAHGRTHYGIRLPADLDGLKEKMARLVQQSVFDQTLMRRAGLGNPGFDGEPSLQDPSHAGALAEDRLCEV
jgi:hypothetical protein